MTGMQRLLFFARDDKAKSERRKAQGARRKASNKKNQLTVILFVELWQELQFPLVTDSSINLTSPEELFTSG